MEGSFIRGDSEDVARRIKLSTAKVLSLLNKCSRSLLFMLYTVKGEGRGRL